MATREFVDNGGATFNQQLYRAGQEAQHSGPAPAALGDGSGASSGGIAGMRAAPTGRAPSRANRFAAGFVGRYAGAVSLLPSAQTPAPDSGVGSEGYGDLSVSETQRVYEMLRPQLAQNGHDLSELDQIAARMQDEQNGNTGDGPIGASGG